MRNSERGAAGKRPVRVTKHLRLARVTAFTNADLRRQSGNPRGTYMQAFVYKSLRKPDTYIYLRERDAFGLLPEPVLLPLGQLSFVMELALTPQRKLAR